MKSLPLLALALALTGCEMLPEDGPPQQRLAGQLLFRETTALPPSARAHVAVLPATTDPADAKPVVQGMFPAPTGTAIPFALKFPADKVRGGGEYLVLAQVVDHGKVWYSNLSAPLRISFAAEPGDLRIPLYRDSR